MANCNDNPFFFCSLANGNAFFQCLGYRLFQQNMKPFADGHHAWLKMHVFGCTYQDGIRLDRIVKKSLIIGVTLRSVQSKAFRYFITPDVI